METDPRESLEQGARTECQAPWRRITFMIEPHEGAAGLIAASRLFVPDAERARGTHCGSVEAWEALLARSRRRPEEFWADVARELEWMRPWDVVQEGSFPHFKYFVGGLGNPTVNLL